MSPNRSDEAEIFYGDWDYETDGFYYEDGYDNWYGYEDEGWYGMEMTGKTIHGATMIGSMKHTMMKNHGHGRNKKNSNMMAIRHHQQQLWTTHHSRRMNHQDEIMMQQDNNLTKTTTKARARTTMKAASFVAVVGT